MNKKLTLAVTDIAQKEIRRPADDAKEEETDDYTSKQIDTSPFQQEEENIREIRQELKEIFDELSEWRAKVE